jgi:trigger factor
MESERDDYRKIAERRVRLGLLLSEIGQANGIEVNSQEMNRLIAQAAQQYGPEDRQKFVQYVQSEPMAAAQLRAPLYEDKVVDFLFSKADVTDRETTKEELEAAIESEDGFATGTHVHNHDDCDHPDHDHAHDHEGHDHPVSEAPVEAAKPARKKPGARGENAGVEAASAETPAAESPAKKPRAKKGAPIAAETQVLESSPVAAEAAERSEAADAPAPKKPRAKKAKPAEA